MSVPIGVVRSPDFGSGVTRVVGSGSGDLAEVARRLDVLRDITHPGLCVPDGIGLGPDGAVLATMPRVKGETALALSRSRKGLSVGECVAIGIDVAEALAALHDKDLAHGDVSPANIVVSPTRAVLVDTLSGARPKERGTPGFSAPERAVGATPAGDVYSLGRVLEALVDETGRDRIAAWAEPLCRPEAVTRPTASVAARALRDCADPVPVSIPNTPVEVAARARAIGSGDGTLRLPEGRVWRVRRAVVSWSRRVGFAVGAVLVVLLFARIVGALLPDGSGPSFLISHPVSAGVQASVPDEAAVALVEARVEALVSADPEALFEVTTIDSVAREADTSIADRLVSGDLRYEGLSVEVLEAETLDNGRDWATVRISYRKSAHVVLDEDRRVEVPEADLRVDVDIAWDDGTWRIERTRPVV